MRQLKHQRVLRFSVVLPVSVELVVGTDDEDPNEDSDWQILAARDPSCEVTPRIVEENMRSADFSALAARAAETQDIDL